jgi:molybdate transport system substrate-binding protein
VGARREDLGREARPVTLHLLSAGAAHSIVHKVARAAGVEIQGTFGAVGAILERFEAGEACDVLILTRKQIDQLTAQGRIVAGCAADLGDVATAIAVRAGKPQPDVSSEAALRDALTTADALYFPDPARATAGIHFAKVIERLGIQDAVQSRSRTFPNGATAMREMAEARGRPLGCTQATEILATAGVTLVAALPPGFDLTTTYCAGVNVAASNVKGATAFVARLTGGDARTDRTAAGFL